MRAAEKLGETYSDDNFVRKALLGEECIEESNLLRLASAREVAGMHEHIALRKLQRGHIQSRRQDN